MFYYEHWLQTNPPLFLVLVRGVTALAGPSEAALRSLAVVLGVASALLLGLLARRMMKPAWALLSVALLLSSREFVQQAQSVKHYAGDVFAALVLLHLSLSYLQSRSARSLQWVLLAYVPLAFLSFAAVFFAPVLLYAACSDSRQRSGEGIVFSPRIGQVGAIVATVLATSGLNWIFFVSRNRNELLHDYWSGRFILHDPARFLGRVAGPIFESVPDSNLLAWLVLLVMLAIPVGIAVRARLWQRPQGIDRAALLCLPLLSAVALSASVSIRRSAGCSSLPCRSGFFWFFSGWVG